MQNQFEQFRQWRRLEAERPTPAQMNRLTDFLNQTDFGRNLLNLLNTEIELVKSPVSHNVMALADLYQALSAVDQSVQNTAQMLALVLDLARDVRDARSNAELAVAIGTRLASLTTAGTVLQTLYAGTIGGDPMALGRALAIYLCPKLSLPDLVRSLGMTTMDLAAGALFDNQFMVFYANSKFSKDGTLTGIDGIGQGREAICRFIHAVLQEGQTDLVDNIFERARAQANRGVLGPEMMGGINAFSVPAFVRALESTIYGGDADFMRGDPNLQRARAEVRHYTELIGDIAEQQGRSRRDVPERVGPAWANESLARNRFDQASREAIRELMQMRTEAWQRATTALCQAITTALEERHKADQALQDDPNGALQAWLEKVEALFRALDIFDLGMAWLQYESSFNAINRYFLISTEEQRIHAMKTLQNYYQAYSTVLNMRNALEAMYRTAAGGEQSLLIRPLTGSPPLTGDPSFDVPQAVSTVEEVGEWLAHYEREFLAIKRKGTNDRLAMLDAPFDRKMLQEIAGAQFNHSLANAHVRSAEHARQQRYRINVAGRFMDAVSINRAVALVGEARARKQEIEQEFRDYYLASSPSLRIRAPTNIESQTAHLGRAYIFTSETQHIPPDAAFRWRVERDFVGEGTDALIEFRRTGRTTITLEADWTESRRSLQAGRLQAVYHVNVLPALPPPEDQPVDDDDAPDADDLPPAPVPSDTPGAIDLPPAETQPEHDDAGMPQEDVPAPDTPPPGSDRTDADDDTADRDDRPPVQPPAADDWTPDHDDDFDLNIDWGNMDWGRIVGDAVAAATAQQVIYGQTASLDFSRLVATTTTLPSGAVIPIPASNRDPQQAPTAATGPQAGQSSVGETLTGGNFIEDARLRYTISGV